MREYEKKRENEKAVEENMKEEGEQEEREKMR
jgi:hypothetical protein